MDRNLKDDIKWSVGGPGHRGDVRPRHLYRPGHTPTAEKGRAPMTKTDYPGFLSPLAEWGPDAFMPDIFQPGPIVAIATIVVAFISVRSTLKTLRHKQYETAANMISSEGGLRHFTRTAAIGSLAKLAKDYPKEYDEPVMRAFEAFLSFPPRYGRNARERGPSRLHKPGHRCNRTDDQRKSEEREEGISDFPSTRQAISR